MNKQEVINYLKELVETEDRNDKVIFKKSDEVFKVFGAEEKGVLNPSNDYTYKWLESFLTNVIELLEGRDFEDFDELEEAINEEMTEWADTETDIYTSDLTEWLNNRNDNVYYLSEAIEEGAEDGFKALSMAQYKAIEELFTNANRCLIEHLKQKFS